MRRLPKSRNLGLTWKLIHEARAWGSFSICKDLNASGPKKSGRRDQLVASLGLKTTGDSPRAKSWAASRWASTISERAKRVPKTKPSTCSPRPVPTQSACLSSAIVRILLWVSSCTYPNAPQVREQRSLLRPPIDGPARVSVIFITLRWLVIEARAIMTGALSRREQLQAAWWVHLDQSTKSCIRLIRPVLKRTAAPTRSRETPLSAARGNSSSSASLFALFASSVITFLLRAAPNGAALSRTRGGSR